jgi:hypothetical protein
MKPRAGKKIATYRVPKDLPHVHSGYLDIDLIDWTKARKLVEGLNLNKIITVGPLDAYNRTAESFKKYPSRPVCNRV